MSPQRRTPPETVELTADQLRFLTTEPSGPVRWPSEVEDHPFDSDEDLRAALRQHQADMPGSHPLAWWWE